MAEIATAERTTLGGTGGFGGKLTGRGSESSDSGDSGGAKPDKGSRVVKKTINGKEYTFRTAELNPSKKTLSREGEEVPIQEETRDFKEETLLEVTEDITKRLETLEALRGGNAEERADFQAFMNHPDYQLHKRFFDRFVTIKPGSRDGVETRIIDRDKMKEWLDTDAGFADAYELIVIDDQEMALNAGLLVDINRPYPKIGAVKNDDVQTGEGPYLRKAGRWVKNKWVHDDLESYGKKTGIGPFTTIGKAGATVGGLTIFATGVGGATLGPLGALGLGAIPPALAEIVRAQRTGERVTYEAAKQALQISRTDDPVKRTWAKRMYGEDPHNLTIENSRVFNRPRVVIRPDILERGIASPMPDPETVFGKLKEKDRLVRAMQKEMGVRREMRSGMDIDHLRGGRRARDQALQRGIVTEDEVLTRFKREVRDGNDNPCQVLFNNEWVDNEPDFYAAFTAQLNAQGVDGAFDRRQMDGVAAWRLRREIHRNLIAERSDAAWDAFLESGQARKDNLLTEISGAKQSREGGGALSRLTENINREQVRLAEDRTRVQRERGIFDAIETDLRTSRERVTAEETARDRVRSLAGGALGGGLTQEQALNQLLTDRTPPPALGVVPAGPAFQIDSQVVTGIPGMIEAERQRYQAEIGGNRALLIAAGFRGKDLSIALDAARADSKTIHDANRAEINTLRTRIIEIRDVIRTAGEQVEASETALRNKTTELDSLNTATREMREARERIEGIDLAITVPPAAIVVTLGTVELQTLTYDELIGRINAASTVGAGLVPPVAVGWPEGDNNNVANRQVLLNAMAEARAAAISDIDAPSLLFERALDPAIGRYTEIDILTLPAAEIQADLTDRLRAVGILAPGAQININGVNIIQAEARRNFEARQNAFVQLDLDINRRNTELENEKTRITTEGVESPELESIERAANRYDQIRQAITEMTTQQLVAALDPAQATDATRYLASEMENNHSIAFGSIQEWLFNHRNRDQESVTFMNQTGRDAAFRRNASLVDEEVLRDALLLEYRMPVWGPPVMGGGPPVLGTFEEHIDVIRNEIAAGRITRDEFAEFLTEGIIFDFMRPRVARL